MSPKLLGGRDGSDGTGPSQTEGQPQLPPLLPSKNAGLGLQI